MYDGTASVDHLYLFGPFSLSPRKRMLLHNGEPVRLGSRALELLIVLTERAGELIGKDELTARLWPTTIVVEANLSVQMAALRRVLRDGCDGNRYIINEPSRGYRMVAPVTVVNDATPMAPSADPSVFEGEFTASVRRLVEVCCLMEASRKASDKASGIVGESPDAGEAAANGILRRGIWALEFVRTLLSVPACQSGANPSDSTHSDESMESSLRRLAGQWKEEISQTGGWAH